MVTDLRFESQRSTPIQRVATAARLLLAERERLTRELAEAQTFERVYRVARRSEEHVRERFEAATAEIDQLRARVAELEAAWHGCAQRLARETERADAAERHVERAMKDGAAAVTGWTKTGKDLEAARARADEAERKLSAVADLQRSTAADLNTARAQLRMVSAGPADVWRWQGDGHDDPASLSCPVVMSAETLRELVAARERVATLGTPTPLDLAVGEVCAVRLTGAPDATSDDIMGNILDLAFEARAGQMRNRFLIIGRLALAGAIVRGEEEQGEAEEERAEAIACDASATKEPG